VNQKRRERKAEQKTGKEMEAMAGSQWTRIEGEF
jgi:hypothetical protein